MFKVIPGFDNYEISDTGEVKSLSRSGVRTDGRTYDVTNKVIKPYMKKGKPYVQLHKDGKKFCKSVSSLLKETFNED